MSTERASDNLETPARSNAQAWEDRVPWLDVARGLGMFLIYLGHFGHSAGLSHPFVFTHHVPLFFFISGCAEALSHNQSIRNRTGKVVSRLLLPWLVFSLLAVFVDILKFNTPFDSLVQNMEIIAKGTIRNQFFSAALWFLPCLAIIRILFGLLRRICSRWILTAVCLFIYLYADRWLVPHPLVHPSLPYNLDSALYYISFYALGFALFPYIRHVLQSKTRAAGLFRCFSFLLSVTYAGSVFYGKDLLNPLSKIPLVSSIHGLARPMLISWMYLVLSTWLQGSQLLKSLGRNSLFLCGCEYFSQALVPAGFAILRLKISLPMPLSTWIYAFSLLLVSNYLLTPPMKELISFIRENIGTHLRSFHRFKQQTP